MAIPRFQGKSAYIGTNSAEPHPLTFTNSSAWSVATAGGRQGSSDPYYKCAPTAGQSTYGAWAITSAIDQFEMLPIGVYIERGIEAGDTADLMGFYENANIALRVTLDDQLRPNLYGGPTPTLIGTLPALSTGKWYQFYIDTSCSTAGMSKDWIYLYVIADDNSYASTSSDLAAYYNAAATSVWFGRRNAPTETTPPIFWFSDAIHMNSTGGQNNSRPSLYRKFYVNDHKPIADNTDGGWTDNASSAADICQAIDNRPPIGEAGKPDISFVGLSNVVKTNGGAPTAITPHASTATGDLMIFYHYSAVDGGNETVTIPTGFTPICNFVSAGNGLIACGYRIKQGGDTTFTASITNHTSGTGGESVIEFIETYRGHDASTPIVEPSTSISALSASTTNLGTISPNGCDSVVAGGMLVVFAGRHDDLNSVTQTTLSGNSLTWVARTVDDTTSGADAAVFTQNGFNFSGADQVPSGKTITGFGTSTSATGAGLMFVIQKAKGTAKAQIRSDSLNAAISHYRADLQSYDEVGVRSTDIVRACQYFARTGVGSSTAITAQIEGISNPAASASNPNFDTSVASNTDGTGTPNWITTSLTLGEAPTITRGTRPVMELGKGVGAAECFFDQAGMYSIVERIPSLPVVKRLPKALLAQ